MNPWFCSALPFSTTASSIPAFSTRRAEHHPCKAKCLVPAGVGPAKAAGLSEGSTEQSSSAREQKGINHLAVIRGSVSTGCLGAFLLPLMPQFAVFSDRCSPAMCTSPGGSSSCPPSANAAAGCVARMEMVIS